MKVRVIAPGGAEFTSYLDNAYSEYQQDPDAREELLKRRIESLIEVSAQPAPLVAANIVPIVKDRAWLAETDAVARRNGARKPLTRVVEDLNETLVIVYAEDTPTNIRYFGDDDLAKAGVEKAKLRQLAIANLRRVLPKLEIHAGEDLTMLVAGGNYEACLLLLDDLWNGGPIKVDGEIVVAVPARDLLIATGSNNQKGITRLREIAAEVAAQSPYSLTQELFVYRKGRFVRFAPDSQHR